jgi:hypothetical protein
MTGQIKNILTLYKLRIFLSIEVNGAMAGIENRLMLYDLVDQNSDAFRSFID